MRRIGLVRWVWVVLVVAGVGWEVAGAEVGSVGALPARLKRAESFLGIHYDFHAGKDCTEIGKNTTREMIENIIRQVRPDYVQIDCKGHPGLSSYPTKVGNQAPGFVGDPLRLWRQVTAEHGVALYMHYSGVWDGEAVRRRPEWAVVGADGKRSDRITSPFGPYVDQLLIPQLRELAGEYGVDGVWVDGECWAALPDWSEAAVKAFSDATGIKDAPRKPGDPQWFEFLQYHREAFRKYLRHYIAEVKKTHPQFQICSNWAYTDHMAERVSAPLDFLSGDYSPDDSVNSARLSARYLAQQGVNWDLMAWSFSRKTGAGGTNQKTAVQIQREAAVVLACGGGFQAYFKQKRDGAVFDERVPVMAEVAKFCRARQAICHHSKAVPQIAVLLSTEAHYRQVNGLFPRDLGAVSGVLQALLENQQSVEVVGEHHLAGRMGEWPMIVVPEWKYLDAKFRDELVGYVKGGGSLMLVGAAVGLFEKEIGGAGGQMKVVTVGKGKIGAVAAGLGRSYAATRAAGVRKLIGDLTRQLFPEPMVRVEGSGDLDVSVARKEGKLLVNLVNTSGPHQTAGVIEGIEAVGPVVVRVRVAERPKTVSLQPTGQSLPFEFQDGQVRVTVPRVEIHDIVVID